MENHHLNIKDSHRDMRDLYGTSKARLSVGFVVWQLPTVPRTEGVVKTVEFSTEGGNVGGYIDDLVGRSRKVAGESTT